MRLYSYWRSSCSWRVRIGLQLKEVVHDVVPVHLIKDGGEQHLAGFLKKSPMAQVPVLEWEEDGETYSLSQSLAILRYLERVHPEPRLFPEEPRLEGKVVELCEVVNAGIQPLQNLAITLILKEQGMDAEAFGHRVITRGFTALENLASQSAGIYAVGDEVTAADLFLVPQMYNARRFNVDLSAFPTLTRVDAACAELPAFLRAHPDQQPDAPTA